ncbi:heavy metal translocating P-type ATPase [Rhodoluna limnophila]|uniref:heavy metal translocating P-type ATPase n=1 Tax=Rhodoluna limnophila TaxID=232537 RepID=UPI0015627EE8|nr:heavy metal translocating P-type ATPase [Rhodoluna limnophila]
MSSAEVKSLDLDIEGMTCTACSRRVEKSLNKVAGVSAYVDFASEKAHLTLSAAVDRADLVKAVEDAGYAVGAERNELKSTLVRLWVGAVIALPVALISMVHDWMPPNWNLIAAIATLPIVIWVAWPFHSAAFKNLRHRATTMDTLVSLGVIIAYGYSLIELVMGGHEAYFEVAAVVPTVVLLGRWLELRTRRSATDSVRALLSAIPDTAVVRRGDQQLTVATNQVLVGDLVIVASGQKVPVDGTVVEGHSQIDNSLITGESVPTEAAVGMTVAAGSLNLGASLVIKTTAASANSRIAQIADLVREATAHKAKISSLTDKISAVFVPAVISISILTFAAWWLIGGDAQAGLRAGIAVLVIACPCALGIAVPMSLAVATSVGARRGIVIRNPDALSLLSKVKSVLLDKTGTLTTGQLRVAKTIPLAGFDEPRAIALAAAIERNSVHPIAKAIAALDSSLSAEGVIETAGTGVSGKVDGIAVEVSRRDASTFSNPDALVAAIAQAGPRSLAITSIDNQAVLLIALEDDLRQEALGTISKLKELGIEPILLSGDVEARVASVAKELGIETYFAGVAPEQKLDVVSEIKTKATGGLIAMVGDGLNDVAALAGADVGLAMGSGTHAAQSAAAITLVDDDPLSIPFALSLGRRTWSNIKQNLGWAFGYNVILIPVAALGLLNPMLAGTAMAFSSISVVLNALRLNRR